MRLRQKIASYLEDPLVERMWSAFRGAGPMRSVSIDITHRCNLRCKGCYFFAESMDDAGEADDDRLHAFIASERERGITFATVLGGEPSLVPKRLKALASAFRLMVVTNGLRSIPQEGLEEIAIAVSMWGDRANDRALRGYGKIDLFDRALDNFARDRRARWYITLPPAPSDDTVEVVDRCVAQGHLVGFNYYGDLAHLGDTFDHRIGFAAARDFVDRMIDRHPGAILTTRYLNKVVTSGEMMGQRWGYGVCGSISVDAPQNAERLQNGNSYNPFFNAYGPDLTAPRRCCVGESRDCATCFDVWAHLSWVAMAIEKHVASADHFFDWLSTMVVFYGACGFIDDTQFRALLPQIAERSRSLDDPRSLPPDCPAFPSPYPAVPA
ncbi:radical SAM protein [uncultured Sphingomonas sp.]|uniref:radical SAM protein n=1 Tax=uncultured Sphingomonas sp. TaxID=158754 RepID=UPI0025DBCDD6|nr:radical SAM protein [uncultured Sphingomonas sp.]